jgi:hypothetical protein
MVSTRRGFLAGVVALAAVPWRGEARSAPAALPFRTIRADLSGRDWSAADVYPRFGGGAPVALLANQLVRREVAVAAKFGRDAAAQFKSLGPPTAPYYYDAAATVALASPALVSVYFSAEDYSGGAHPNHSFVAYTIGFVRGRSAAVGLQDIFRPGVNGAAAASEMLMAGLRGNPRATFVQDGTVKSIDPAVASVFVVTPSTIAFLLPPYAVAPYVNGAFVVKFRFAEFGGRLDPAGPLRPLLT